MLHYFSVSSLPVPFPTSRPSFAFGWRNTPSLHRHLPTSRHRLRNMAKRKLDEFLELAKDLSVGNTAEGLSTLPPEKRRRILSHPKVNTSPRQDRCSATRRYRGLIHLTVHRRRERPPSTNKCSTVLDLPVLTYATKMGH